MTESEVEARTRASAIRTFSWTIKHPGIKGDAVVLPLKDWDYLIDKGVGLAVARAEVERLRGVVRVVESEHYRVFSPEEPPEGGCICMAYPCPELEALDVLAALKEGE